MFFNLFGKKEKQREFTDMNFINAAAKTAALIHLAKTNDKTIFIAWFADTSVKYKNEFSNHQLNPDRIIDAKQFHSSRADEQTIVFLEHYPLRSNETELVKNLPGNEVLVYNSLDEPLFSFFGGERIITLMQKMGLKEEEVITHPMIGKSIIRAQEKIAQKVITVSSARSQQEWMDKNIK